jgi:putative oxidoreductase
MGYLNKLETKAQNISFYLDPFLRFVPRFIIGAVFIPAGWAKLQNLNHTIEYFSTLGIPLSTLLAPLAAFSEVVFGIFILVGFYTRIATVPLFTIMTIALLTAHRKDVSSVLSLTELNPALYAVILICIFSLGSGSISLDQMFFRRK